jgi:UDP-N-acetyl-D-galactosamine dehydrogenase
VYPGVTEDVCVPILERVSGLSFGRDFTVGYSPERINPGDKEHTFTKIIKVVSGSDAATGKIVADVYRSVVTAGVHEAPSIKVAEAAKVIENTQRDLNIALMNELAIIFNRIGIDTREVLEAAGTKWNFLKFSPGLVGGHCIGVDPYYLTHIAERLGYIPQVILSGRRINDGMGAYLAQQTIKQMIRSGHHVANATVTVFGLTFKENCPDLRNSRVVDVIRELESFGVKVQVCDPEADPEEARHEYGVELCELDKLAPAQALVAAVAHDRFRQMKPADLLALLSDNPVIVDVKSMYDRATFAAAGVDLWRL